MKNCLLVIIFLAFQVSAKEFKFFPKEKFYPKEMELILQYIQEESLTTYQIDSLKKSILKIDQLADHLNEEELLFVTKTEIYKTFLTPTDKRKIKKEEINPFFLKIVTSAKEKNRNSPLVFWYLSGIEKDLATIFNDSRYKDIMLLKTTNQAIPIDLLKLEKRLELVIKLAINISPDNPTPFKKELLEKSFLFFKNLENAFLLLVNQTRFNINNQKKELNSLTTFTYKEEGTVTAENSPSSLEKMKLPPKNKKSSSEKSIDEIIDPIISPKNTDTPQKLPLPVQEESWLPDPKTEQFKKDLPKPSDESEWLPDF